MGRPISPLARLAFASSLLLVMVISVLDRERIDKILKQKHQDVLIQSVQTSALSSIVAHNLKTPITKLYSLVELIEIDGLNEKRFDNLKSSTLHAVREVDLMVNSRKFFTLDPGLLGFVDLWKSQHERATNIRLAEIPLFVLNEQQAIALYVALETFTNNSFEHGASEVKISATGDEQNIIFYHEDDGEGMEREALSRFGSAVKSAKKGHSGIGVYYTTKLLDATNIPFSVQSTKQQGTTIELSITNNEAQAKVRINKKSPTEISEAFSTWGGNRTRTPEGTGF